MNGGAQGLTVHVDISYLSLLIMGFNRGLLEGWIMSFRLHIDWDNAVS